MGQTPDSSRELAWRFWGAHASRVLVSASTPKQTFQKFKHLICSERTRKVRDGEDAIASTRDACAPQNIAFETSG